METQAHRSTCSRSRRASLRPQGPWFGAGREKLWEQRCLCRAGACGAGSLGPAVTLPFYTQGRHHSSTRTYTNNRCAYIKEIFINTKANSAKTTSSPGGEDRVAAQVSRVLLHLQPGSPSHGPLPAVTTSPKTGFKPLYLEGSYAAFGLISQLTINFQPNWSIS